MILKAPPNQRHFVILESPPKFYKGETLGETQSPKLYVCSHQCWMGTSVIWGVRMGTRVQLSILPPRGSLPIRKRHFHVDGGLGAKESLGSGHQYQSHF